MSVAPDTTAVDEKGKDARMVADAEGVPTETLVERQLAADTLVRTLSHHTDDSLTAEDAKPNDPKKSERILTPIHRAWYDACLPSWREFLSPQFQFLILSRFRYERIPFVSTKSDPPPPTLDDAPIIPLHNANLLSQLTFHWLSPILATGYSRPLEPTDLWKLDDERSANYYATKIDESWERRVKEAAEYNARLDRGEIQPGALKRLRWTLSGKREEKEKEWRTSAGRKKPSLLLALK